MPLIIVDDDLPGIPRRLVDVLHQLQTFCLEPGGVVRYVVGFQVEVEVFAFIDVWDGRVFLIDKLQVKNLIPSSDADVKILVLKRDREPQLLGVEADRRGHVCRAQLWDDGCDRHGLSLKTARRLAYLGRPKNKTYPSGSVISKPRKPSCVSASGALKVAP